MGGFVAMGGHVGVIWQPWEYVIICGSALGTFVVANPMKTIKDSGKGIIEAFKGSAPTHEMYIDLLAVLYNLMRELRSKPRNEVEAHFDNPTESPLFQKFPSVVANAELLTFICDYCRLIIIGNARTHEIEALMDEEIQTVKHDTMKAYHSMVTISEAFPALGIVAAVLGVIHTMGAITEPPEVLGHLIGAALVGTFSGVLAAYGFVAPIGKALEARLAADEQVLEATKTALVAHTQGYAPQISVEFARKTIATKLRPTFVELDEKLNTIHL